jgi:hypothetical protein
MDYMGHTVLSVIFILVGMMFVVPAITEKTLAIIHATATGACGPPDKYGQSYSCEFTWEGQNLSSGKWTSEPTKSGHIVKWSTHGSIGWVPTDERGSVTYKVGEKPGEGETAVLFFDNPTIGTNKCSISGIGGSCEAGKGLNAVFNYNLRGK